MDTLSKLDVVCASGVGKYRAKAASEAEAKHYIHWPAIEAADTYM